MVYTASTIHSHMSKVEIAEENKKRLELGRKMKGGKKVKETEWGSRQTIKA